MAKKDYFPTEQSSLSYWLSEETAFSRFRSTENIPAEVDTLIIGSGYAGTAVAHHLLEQDPSHSVALYEARNICSGATGRNGGHIKPYVHYNYDMYTKMFGEKTAVEITNFEWDHLWIMKKLIDDNAIDCDFVLTRSCDIYPYKNDPKLQYDLKCMDRLMKNPDVSEDMKKQIQIFYGEAARIISKNPTTEVAVTYPTAQCWPWKLMMALLKKAVDKGLNLHANTLVTKVTQREDGKWVVKTSERGETVCNKVVFCTNGYTKALLTEFNEAIVPHKGVCSRIVTKDKTNIPYLTNTYAIVTSIKKGDYLINRPDGSIIVGGQDESLLDMTSSGEDAIKEQYDNVDDTYVTEKVKQAFSEEFMGERFTTWKDVPVEVSHLWSGIMGYTNDYLPYVGELDSIGKGGAYICAGFHGHGMPRIWLCGKAIATTITQNKDIKDIPYTIPSSFFVTKERIAVKNGHKDELIEFVKTKPTLSKV